MSLRHMTTNIVLRHPLPSERQVGANCAETVSFVEELSPNDPLIKGVPDDKNPYKGDKGGCLIT